ncbi:MAG TPA: YceH family protein [Mucilaginibacter sp.]|nr:YceH family protein [Mucilaginibacter sp.]
MDLQQALPALDDTELRVLGSLMEKSRTTPDYYPMTVNSLIAACNQKTSRNPVVQYNEETIVLALNTLKKRGLVSTATGGTDRVVKYKHNFAIVYPVIPSQVAIICLLVLRGPQTPGELNTNSGRLYEFESIEEVQDLLTELSSGQHPFIKQLPRKPGQKEQRYVHLLGGSTDWSDESVFEELPRASSGSSGLEARVAKLEKELAELKEAFDKLMKELS